MSELTTRTRYTAPDAAPEAPVRCTRGRTARAVSLAGSVRCPGRWCAPGRVPRSRLRRPTRPRAGVPPGGLAGLFAVVCRPVAAGRAGAAPAGPAPAGGCGGAAVGGARGVIRTLAAGRCRCGWRAGGAVGTRWSRGRWVPPGGWAGPGWRPVGPVRRGQAGGTRSCRAACSLPGRRPPPASPAAAASSYPPASATRAAERCTVASPQGCCCAAARPRSRAITSQACRYPVPLPRGLQRRRTPDQDQARSPGRRPEVTTWRMRASSGWHLS